MTRTARPTPTQRFFSKFSSKSTEGYDRGLKSQNYRRIETLRAYALVSQTNPYVEIYERQPDNRWLLREVTGSNPC